MEPVFFELVVVFGLYQWFVFGFHKRNEKNKQDFMRLDDEAKWNTYLNGLATLPMLLFLIWLAVAAVTRTLMGLRSI